MVLAGSPSSQWSKSGALNHIWPGVAMGLRKARRARVWVKSACTERRSSCLREPLLDRGEIGRLGGESRERAKQGQRRGGADASDGSAEVQAGRRAGAIE